MNDQYSQIIVNRILSLCQQHDFTIYQLSTMSGISYSTLDNLIKYKTFNPKIKTLHKIASAFSLTLSEFFDLMIAMIRSEKRILIAPQVIKMQFNIFYLSYHVRSRVSM